MSQLDFTDPAVQARLNRDRGMKRAARGAESKSPGWNEKALAAVHAFALSHTEPFLAEQIRASMDWADVDARAFGPVMKEAERRGWIRRDGYAPANSSHRSPKVRWRSRIQ